MINSLKICFLFTFCFFACKGNINPPIKNSGANKDLSNVPLDKLKLPKGFEIELYAEGVINARSMSIAEDGTLFVGTRSGGNVYALVDTDNNGKVDKQYTIFKEGNMPNGVAYKDGDLFIAEVNRILKIENVLSKLEHPGEPIVIFDDYPNEGHHGWKYIAFGPDGRLYVPVGAPCNICKSDEEIFATITSIKPDGTDLRIEQHGVRNTVGFTWHPETKQLWFTDNGGDMLGDDMPACELNVATKSGQHFGYPYCHQGDFADPDFGHLKTCDSFEKPNMKLGAHVAPLGLEFCMPDNWPAEYQNKIFIAEHGSWNRSKKSGYQISMVSEKDGETFAYVPFIDGWLNPESDDVWGRPVDIEWMKDGSMLISDDFANVIYRVTYKG